MPRITPIVGEPLLLVERDLKVLVAADLHIGIEHQLWRGGASVPSQTAKLLASLLSWVEEVGPDRLILLGDVKHNVPWHSFQERSEVPAFLESLSRKTKLHMVFGNHDVGLADLAPPETMILPPRGFVLDGVGYFHGHTWPNPDLFEAEALVAAHLHPAIRMPDPLGYGRPKRVWVRSPLSSKVLESEYGRKSDAPEMVIVPAFNPLCGGYPLNRSWREDRGPLPRMALLERSRVYLLDGTDLGRLDRIKAQ